MFARKKCCKDYTMSHSRFRTYLTPNVVCRSVEMPLTKKIVPISSLRPTISESRQKCLLSRNGIDMVAPADVRKCWNIYKSTFIVISLEILIFNWRLPFFVCFKYLLGRLHVVFTVVVDDVSVVVVTIILQFDIFWTEFERCLWTWVYLYRHFRQFSLRIVLRSCVNDSKPMDCGYESHRRLYVLIFYFAIVV